ncbi:MAG: AMP-binding protein [Deltaproteobacteria bacterium]|nr:AMP-binding protein [Deltaproteobacteria bacterium]
MYSADVFHERTIPHVLREKVRRYGNRTFFFFKEQEFGYEDFDRESDRVAAGLQALGVTKGDKVAIVMNNRPEFLFLWFGLAKLGAVEVPLNTAHKGPVLTYMLDKADCKLIVAESQYLDRVGPALADVPKVEQVVVLAPPGEKIPALGKPAVDFRKLSQNDGRYEQPEVLWSDPFAIMFTSGTTGPSKGPVLPQNYALLMGEIISRSAEYTEKDRLYNALPLFHGNAQVLSTMPALLSGAQMVLAERFSASSFWSEVRKYGCTEFNYIGGILPILLKAEPRADDADNPLRVLMGAGCTKDLFAAVEKRFQVQVLEGYGMSEIGLPLMNTLQSPRKAGSIGRPAYGSVVKLVDDDGLEVAPGVPGEVLIRPSDPFGMLLEYYKMPEQTVEAWRDLWFHTGDYAMRDEEGYYFFVDRKKDALRRRGENISSYEVEKVVNFHPAVLESAAIAVKDDMNEDEVLIVVTPKPGERVEPEKLFEHCRDRMAYFMVPRYVRVMGQMPKTATEKVQKAELRKQGITADAWDRVQAGYEVKR